MNEAEILKAIAEYLGVTAEDLDRGASLRDDLSLGSIEINDLLSNLSLKFKVTISPDETENLNKIEDIVVLIEDNLID